jgi:DNA-directed RNA polymerase specialized sigma24 family protein
VLYLYTCEELSLEEIAEVLNSSRQAVTTNLHLARKRMRQLLADIYEDRFPRCKNQS